jgi:hypothetical protein
MSTSGVSVYKHYCGDFLASLSIYSPGHGCGDEDTAGCDETDAAMDCCEDETEFYKAELDLVKPVKEKLAFHFFILPFEVIEKTELPKLATYTTELKDRGPPNLKVPLYISLSRLTYYG